jgi:hypothetical protein
MPSSTTYCTDAVLTINKKATHLLCPSGMGCDIGATNAARIMQITANTGLISISAAAVEVAGLYLKHSACSTGTFGNLGSAIDVTTNGYCVNIHHNYFAINGSGATNSPVIATVGAAASWGQIHHNKLVHLTDGVSFASIIAIGTGPGCNTFEVSHNSYNAGCGAGVTVTNVIDFGTRSLYGEANFNLFTASSANAGDGIVESAITACINLALSCSAIGNRGAVQAGRLLAGGNAARSFCDNIDGASSTTAGMASQLET